MMKTWIVATLFLAAICVGNTSALAVVKPPETRIVAGQNVIFTCTVKDVTAKNKFLYWQTPNGTHLPDSDPHTVVTENGTQLHIDDAKLSNAGTYYCVYLDDNDVVRKPAILYVSGKLSLHAPSPQYLVIGRPGHLVCDAVGKGLSAVTYRWKYDKKFVVGTGIKVAKNGDLTFTTAVAADAGNYTCVAETVLQEARQHIEVETVKISDLPKAPTNCELTAKFSHMDVCITIPDAEKSTATRYKVMYWPTSAPKNVTTVIVNKSEFKCPFDISGLEDDTSYSVKVAVGNAIAFGPESTVYTAKTNRAKCPTMPTDVKITPMYTHAMIAWMPPSGDGGLPVTEYRVEYRLNDTDDAYMTVTGTKSPIKVPDLKDNTMYEFKVAARNKRCWGPSFEEVEMTKQLGAPDMPTQLFLKSTDHSITVSWKPPTTDHGRPVTEYLLEYRMVGQTKWIKVDNATSPYTLSKLTYNKEYQVRVSAMNAIGMGAALKSQTKTIVITAPTAPRNITTQHLKYDSVMVSWMAPISDEGAAITGYQVEYQMRSGKVVSKNWFIVKTAANVLTANLTKLNASTDYNVRVGALNVAGITYSTPLTMIKTPGAPLGGFAIFTIVSFSIVGALIVADIILYFALDTGVTKKVVTMAKNRQGYEKAPEGEQNQ